MKIKKKIIVLNYWYIFYILIHAFYIFKYFIIYFNFNLLLFYCYTHDDILGIESYN